MEKSSLSNSWKEWRPRLVELLITAALLIVVLFFFLRFTGWVEGRSGVVLSDPVLELLTPVDLSWQIFLIIYGGLLAGLILMWRRPESLLHFLRAYILLVLIRVVAMWVTPLDPPAGMILLVDPLASAGPGGALTRDLFFSGHTATMILLILVMRRRAERLAFGFTALVLAGMLLLQHVHYTVDILAAIPFAYLAYRLTARGVILPERYNPVG